MLSRLIRGQQALLLLDQVVSSASNFVTLVLAARLLDPLSFSFYALFQLLVTTSIGLMRSGLLAPALAAQRTVGRVALPFKWAFAVVPAFVGLALPLLLAAGAPPGERLGAWILVALTATGAVVAQDYLRYEAMSAGHVGHALTSDLVWLAALMGSLSAAVAHKSDSVHIVAIAWGGSAALASMVGLWSVRRVGPSRDKHSLRAVWKLGRWAMIDSSLAAGAILLPTFITAVTIESPLAGVYRILLTVTSPLNLIHTTVAISFGLSAHSLQSSETINRQRQTVKKTLRVLLPLACCVGLAGPLVLWIAGIPITSAALEACLLVGLAAILGAWVGPKLSLAQALGYQAFGAVVRVLSVLAVAAISVLSLAAVPPFGTDPIGPSLLAGALISCIGWEIAYRRALSIELGSTRICERRRPDGVSPRPGG